MKKLYFDMNSNARNTNLGQVEKCDSVKLEIKLLQDVDYSDSSFRLLGNKADKNKVEQKDNYISEENKVIFTLKREFLTCPGIVKLELNISTTIEEYTTSMFYFFVSDTINSKIIESIQDVETIQELENYIKNANDNLDKVSETSKELDYLNSKIKPEEEKRLQAEAMRLQNEKFRNIDEHNRKSSEKIREGNEDSRNTSEEERVINEETRKNNELKRKTAENLRVSRENSREEAELQRQNLFEENESVRNESENARIKNETLRIKSEKLRITNEDNRILQEENRSNNEETREISENARIEAEKIREQQEEHREQHYNSFNEAENERVSNEEKRQEAEIIRNTGEESRNTKYEEAELVRNTSFEEAEKNRSRIYNEAENERAENEKNRIITESKRNTKEDVRVKAEETRVSAETKRVEAEKLRATSEEERHAYIEETVKPAVELVESYDSRITQNATDIKQNSKEIVRAFDAVNDGSFLPFNGENVTVEHSKIGFTKDMQIEGMTYQNLFDSYTKTWNTSNWNNILPLVSTLKPSTVYTLVLDITNNTINKGFNIACDDGNQSTQFISPNFTVSQGFNGRLVKKVMSKANLTDCLSSFYTIHDPSSYTGSCNVKGMLLEGDYTNSYTPSYFEGIKSVGEKENKISILSTGKNLFNVKKLEDYGMGFTLVDETTNTFTIDNHKNNKDLLEIMGMNILRGKSNITISHTAEKVSGRGIGVFEAYHPDGTTTILGHLSGGKFKKTITKPIDKLIFSYSDTGVTKFSNIIISEEEFSEFEPYKQDKKEILLPFSDGFKGLINGAKDTTILKEDGLYIRKKIKRKVLNGSEGEDWGLSHVFTNTISVSLNLTDAVARSGNEAICDKLTYVDGLWQDAPKYDVQAFDIGGKGTLNMRILKSNLETYDITGLKKYLSQNLIIIYYELATPVDYKITDLNSINLETFKDMTYVSSENEIQPKLSFKAPADVPATISSLKAKNISLEQENKQLKDEVDTKTLKLHDQDVELTNSDLDLDFRIFELEMSIGAPINLNMKGMKSMARSPFEMMRILILNNNYDREDIEYKASRYLQGKRITQAEYDEIISLMDANELVK